MQEKTVILYSSTLAILLMALSAWLADYQTAPQTANMNKLYEITSGISALSQQSHQSEVIRSASNELVLMGWWYPGAPACNALKDAAQIQFDVLKPEYFAIREGGELEFMTAENYACNGYSPSNAEQVKQLSAEQYVMVSSAYAKDMELFLDEDARSNRHTQQILAFVKDTGFTGVELDFEDYGGWTPDIYDKYKQFVTRLGSALHAENKKLIIDVPPVRNSAEEQWYTFRLGELELLPLDYILVMGYDYQYDHGVGEPVAPLDWLGEVVRFTRDRVTNDAKIVIGVPSYGYVGDKNTGQIHILTHEQASQNPLYGSAQRDTRSQEMIAETDTKFLVYQDSTSLNAKIATVETNGIKKVSIWHLGGNVLPTE